jgi:pimeloyl-ACP methyl ester carboxylesterase
MNPEKRFEETPVSWRVDEIEVEATLARPDGPGPFPAVVFVAGSGPTDRDWNSPLLPGMNGSGALLARLLAERGYITLRYDKRGSGPHLQENIARLAGRISMEGHRQELAGGIGLLAAHPDVDPARIFALTNSEGCIHAINYQIQEPAHPLAGLVLTSAFARAAGELSHTQIAAQLAAVPGGDAYLAAYDAAMDDFIHERPVRVDETLPDPLKQLIAAITQPVNQPFARELWAYDPLTRLPGIAVPILIVIGKKDIQVDWQVEGSLFESVAEDHPNLRVVYLENANHILKYEPLERTAITPNHAMATYGAGDIPLDPAAVETITVWLTSLS